LAYRCDCPRSHLLSKMSKSTNVPSPSLDNLVARALAEDSDVVVTSGGKSTTLKGSDKINSREAIGIWKVGNKAWKVYGRRKTLDDLREDYSRAAIYAGLPMGNPSFVEGQVKVGANAPTNGFVLVTEWMVGTNFQKTVASFKAALSKESVPKDKSDTDYKRVQGGCVAANIVGLRD